MKFDSVSDVSLRHSHIIQLIQRSKFTDRQTGRCIIILRDSKLWIISGRTVNILGDSRNSNAQNARGLTLGWGCLGGGHCSALCLG